MKKLNLLLFALFFAAGTALHAQTTPDPKEKGLSVLTDEMMRAQLNFLASDFMEGRATVEKGGRMAAEYISTLFESAGLEPGGDLLPNGKRSFLQTVPLLSSTKGEKQSLTLILSDNRSIVYQENVDYFINGRADRTTELKGELVFAGYGMIDDTIKYNDFAGIDVRNKIVVILSGFPGHKDPKSKAYSRFKPQPRIGIPASDNGFEYMKNNGALGIIYVQSVADYKQMVTQYAANRTFYPSESISPVRYSLQAVGNTFPNQLNPAILFVSPKVGALLFGPGSEEWIAAYEKATADLSKVSGRTLPGKKIAFYSQVDTKVYVSYNVVGFLKGKNPNKALVVSGHYDHMGMKDGFIWNGADDNASGTVAVASIAKAFAKAGSTPENSVIFAAWTGEENGLIGSTYFVNNFESLYPGVEITANINFDMIGRNDSKDKEGKNIEMEYSVDIAPQFGTICSDNVKKYGLDLNVALAPVKNGKFTGATDYVPFFRKGIPFAGWFSGFHPDYHRYTDDLPKINYRKFSNVTRLGFLNAWDMANPK